MLVYVVMNRLVLFFLQSVSLLHSCHVICVQTLPLNSFASTLSFGEHFVSTVRS